MKDIQKENGKDEKKLVQKVKKRWNSTFYMFQFIVDEHREVKLTLCSVDHEDLSISTGDLTVINEALELLKPFEEATRELSADTWISLLCIYIYIYIYTCIYIYIYMYHIYIFTCIYMLVSYALYT